MQVINLLSLIKNQFSPSMKDKVYLVLCFIWLLSCNRTVGQEDGTGRSLRLERSGFLVGYIDDTPVVRGYNDSVYSVDVKEREMNLLQNAPTNVVYVNSEGFLYLKHNQLLNTLNRNSFDVGEIQSAVASITFDTVYFVDESYGLWIQTEMGKKKVDSNVNPYIEYHNGVLYYAKAGDSEVDVNVDLISLNGSTLIKRVLVKDVFQDFYSFSPDNKIMTFQVDKGGEFVNIEASVLNPESKNEVGVFSDALPVYDKSSKSFKYME